MAVRLPTLEQIDDLGSDFGLVLTADEIAAFQQAFKGPLASYGRLDELVPPALAPIAPRSPGYRPAASENPYGAWYWKTNIKTGAEGLLSGKKVAIKDNICVAGVPMMNGSALLEGYVPELDATVVTRILDAGGTIAGKAACEDLCFSGASHTCAGGVIRNPHNPAHSAGGSSGGSAALVAAGEVPMALGGDQGGSIRTPSSWCGVYGLKPTWGLVPTTGSMPISYSVDHCGPMCASVEDVARLLTVIAGHDGWDTRTIAARTGDYMAALGNPAKGLRIGVLREGFGHPESDPAVNEKVRQTIAALGQGRHRKRRSLRALASRWTACLERHHSGRRCRDDAEGLWRRQQRPGLLSALDAGGPCARHGDADQRRVADRETGADARRVHASPLSRALSFQGAKSPGVAAARL